MHPNRFGFGFFSDRNPFVAAIAPLAEAVRQDRCPVAPNNPLLAIESVASNWIETSLKLWGQARDALVEQFFLAFFGSPMLQSMVGLNAKNADLHRRIEHDVTREATANRLRAELESAIDRGGVVEAFVRALAYVLEPVGEVDDRGFAALKEAGRMVSPGYFPDFARFREIVRQQFLILHLDEERAIEALPKLVASAEDRRLVLESLHRIRKLRQPELNEEQQRRLSRVEKLLAPLPTRTARRENVSATE